jgi:predicted Na+-dependent transporter
VPLYVKILMYLFVAVYMVSVMPETTSGEIVMMLKYKRRMGLALLANLVVVSFLGFVLVHLLHLRPDVRIGVMMLVVSPGGFFAYNSLASPSAIASSRSHW